MTGWRATATALLLLAGTTTTTAEMWQARYVDRNSGDPALVWHLCRNASGDYVFLEMPPSICGSGGDPLVLSRSFLGGGTVEVRDSGFHRGTTTMRYRVAGTTWNTLTGGTRYAVAADRFWVSWNGLSSPYVPDLYGEWTPLE